MNRPNLTIPVDEARKKISLQLKRGHAIQKYDITSKDDLENANSQRHIWYDYTKNLLESIDKNYALVEQFHYLTPTVSSGERTLLEKIHDFRYHMDKDVTNLQSIYNSLDLIKNFKKDKTNYGSKRQRKLTPAQEKLCWDNNTHICNLCGNSITRISDVEFEHSKAFAKGGKTNLKNVKLSHRACNKQKGKKNLSEARSMLGYYANVRENKAIESTDETQFDVSLEQFFENTIHRIRIRNTGTKTIESCTILCKKEKCDWWDTNHPLPRHIYAGGGGNVNLPQGSEKTNPLITIISGKKAIRRIKLSDIPLTNP